MVASRKVQHCFQLCPSPEYLIGRGEAKGLNGLQKPVGAGPVRAVGGVEPVGVGEPQVHCQVSP